ncbi:transporter [Zavarzinia compransoris]|uniref:Transporter n=1 Tax=Zavarzinia compransoris TaxID=1264899 RepID=A0A317DY01_9PROT|nr:transporter [Zavarzinia compransoris]PWR17715.1 transporter [Zavarzinia compransoris]TDP49238.1 outer membrane putative beta-barrel porin/alpha-amylase [Zavarzinia compransoris]
MQQNIIRPGRRPAERQPLSSRAWAKAALAAALAAALPATARAVDISPGDYAALPEGTNLALAYFQYSSHDSLDVDGVGKVPDSGLDAYVGLARYVHYLKVGDMLMNVQAILPYGGFGDVRIGGVEQKTANGLGDLILGVSAFLKADNVGDRGTTLGFVTYFTLPTGNYDPAKVSLGSGTYTVTPQVGVIQGLGGGFVLDLAADVAFTFDHEELGVKRTVDPAWQAQGYLRYLVSPETSVSFGYSGRFEGQQRAGGVYTGLKSDSQQLRLFASTFATPSFQIQGMVGADIAGDGGFRQDFTAQIRLLKVF